MDIIETLRCKLHIAINEQSLEKALKISVQLDKEIVKHMRNIKSYKKGERELVG